jgi:hypothetical protein
MNIKKSANVMSNDSLLLTLPINFSGKVVADTDTVSTIVFGPNIIEFTPQSRKHEITFDNVKDSVDLNIRQIGYVVDNFTIKAPGKPIEPGKKGKIEVEWKGDLPEYDIERSITFETGSIATPRFSVAYSIKGIKGPRPAPVKPAKPQQAKAGTSPNSPMSKGGAVRSTTSSRPAAAPARADSIKRENPLDQKNWPPK